MSADLSMREDHVADREMRLECAKLAGANLDSAREIYAFVSATEIPAIDEEHLRSIILEVVREDAGRRSREVAALFALNPKGETAVRLAPRGD